MANHKQATSSKNEKCNEIVASNDNSGLLPHLESFDKMLKLPMVEAAWNQGQDVYGKVKGTFYA